MSFLTRPSSTSSSLFPIFLVPPIPFRRRKSCTESSKSNTTCAGGLRPPTATPERAYLKGHSSRLRCARCAADLCPTSQIISKGFTGRHGRAYLVSASPVADVALHDPRWRQAKKVSLPNTYTHKAMPRQLVTGAHTVSDVSCAFCGSIIGWKYDSAEEETQRYKVGKYILETKKIFSSPCWENGDPDDHNSIAQPSRTPSRQVWEDSVQFDSQDEDECEDLFAGVWSPALAVRRRQGKRFDRVLVEQASA
ncbi:MAG: hypothetical protein Q9222_000658 [Ikaeria aurantiellina]